VKFQNRKRPKPVAPNLLDRVGSENFYADLRIPLLRVSSHFRKHRAFKKRKGKLPEMPERGDGKATLGIQLAWDAIRENPIFSGLWLHPANLRLPLILAQISGKIRPDSFKRLPGIRENSLFD
jgi:hypothetical protein